MSERLLWDRLGALSGILFVLLTVAAVAVGSTPMELQPEQPAASLARELAETRDASHASMRLLLVAVFFLFWFLALLRDRLAAAEQEKGWASSVAFAAGLAAATLLLVGAAAGFAQTVEFGDDPVVAKTFFVYGLGVLQRPGPPGSPPSLPRPTWGGFSFAALPAVVLLDESAIHCAARPLDGNGPRNGDNAGAGLDPPGIPGAALLD